MDVPKIHEIREICNPQKAPYGIKFACVLQLSNATGIGLHCVIEVIKILREVNYIGLLKYSGRLTTLDDMLKV